MVLVVCQGLFFSLVYTKFLFTHQNGFSVFSSVTRVGRSKA